MQILRGLSDLTNYLRNSNSHIGCLADTGFLYAMAYDDDRLFNHANDVIELLAEANVPIYANVISRLEFIDLIFRKQVTAGAISLYNQIDDSTKFKNLFNLLKNVRDQDTASKRQQVSYKLDESRLKRLRAELENATDLSSWRDFCRQFVAELLVNEWIMTEEDLDLRFIEVLDGQISQLFNEPLKWSDMVRVMGEQGLRGPDAMIVNLFSKSKLPMLITNDSDLELCFSDPLLDHSNKAIYILQ